MTATAEGNPQHVIVLTSRLRTGEQLPWSLDALYLQQYDTEDPAPKSQVNYVLEELVIFWEMDLPNLLEQSNK